MVRNDRRISLSCFEERASSKGRIGHPSLSVGRSQGMLESLPFLEGKLSSESSKGALFSGLSEFRLVPHHHGHAKFSYHPKYPTNMFPIPAKPDSQLFQTDS